MQEIIYLKCLFSNKIANFVEILKKLLDFKIGANWRNFLLIIFGIHLLRTIKNRNFFVNCKQFIHAHTYGHTHQYISDKIFPLLLGKPCKKNNENWMEICIKF